MGVVCGVITLRITPQNIYTHGGYDIVKLLIETIETITK